MKFLISCAVVVALWSCPASAADPAGKAVYDKSCKSCHGAEGQGNPTIAKMMKVEMRPLGSKEVQAKSDDDLKKVITKGTGKMKPVTSLSPKQADEVVTYLRTFKSAAR